MLTAALAICALFPCETCAQTNHYVWLGGGHAAPYTNWTTAATNIQAAINASGTNDVIWVTNGMYNTGCGGLDGNLSNRVVVNRAVTLQSVNGPAQTTIEGAYDPVFTNGPAAIRCVYVTVADAKLIGITMRNGATSGAGSATAQQSGGGLRNGWASNCWIIGNNAFNNGGGACDATLFNCIVSGNITTNGTGGGLFNCNVYSSTLANNTGWFGGGLGVGKAHDCLIISNRAVRRGTNMGEGGGVCGRDGFAGQGRAIVSNCVLEANYASWGSATDACTNYNCIIRGNHGDRAAVTGTDYDGSGIVGASHNCWIYDNSGAYESSAAMRTHLYNCVIFGNYGRNPQYPAAILNCRVYNCTIISNSTAPQNNNAVRLATTFAINPLVVNSIVYDNTGGNIYMTTGTVTYTCAPTLPALAGEGCTTNNPLFAAPGEGDWRLTRESPCLNKGLNMGWMTTPGEPGGSDLDGGPRVRHHTVDMGAYELRVPRGSTFSAE